MTKIDLITGFLGSGKTTFLKQYVRYLSSRGERVAILEFDYGAINVDMMLLQEFNDTCDLEMVAGGCDYDCHLRRFKTKLIAMGMRKYDRVIVEPSGIFDPDEFFDTLYEEPLDSWYEIGSVICVVDAGLSANLSEDSRYVLMAQIASSGLILLSKTQLYSQAQISKSIKEMMGICSSYGVDVDPNRILAKPFSSLGEEDYARILHCSYLSQPHIKRPVMEHSSYSSLNILNAKLSQARLEQVASLLFSDPSYGHVLRLKGFFLENGHWHEFNRTKDESSCDEIPLGQDVAIVIGEDLDEIRCKTLFVGEEK